ncbi:MAG: hypothetical protein ABSG33_03295 [Candidatus Bathyarchaeia archaeon]|jgi:hypothetical protein
MPVKARQPAHQASRNAQKTGSLGETDLFAKPTLPQPKHTRAPKPKSSPKQEPLDWLVVERLSPINFWNIPKTLNRNHTFPASPSSTAKKNQTLNQKINPKQALPEPNCRLIEHLDSGINGFIPVFSASPLFSSRKNEIL